MGQMPDTGLDHQPPPNVSKFQDPDFTARGEARAFVSLTRLQTLWFNTGSLCNITCDNCYIESSPRNDRLAYLSLADVRSYLDEIADLHTSVEEIGFTGGEPFLNREFAEMLGEALARGYRALVLTNAMRPMQRRKPELLDLCSRHGPSLTIRVSIDHFQPEKHEAVRGRGTWRPMLEGLQWLAAEDFGLHVAGRTLWNEPEAEVRAGYARLFGTERIPIDAHDPASLVLFPEMDLRREVPEITTRCWSILDVHPTQMMCASSRMVIKRKGAERPVVVPCTLLPYDSQFELGQTLAAAKTTVKLNHPFCAQFCVLGKASCSAA
jgi:uncharacterized Fe-S cluster-containing radical SAM superfamily protein